jgi:hypothetical protein
VEMGVIDPLRSIRVVMGAARSVCGRVSDLCHQHRPGRSHCLSATLAAGLAVVVMTVAVEAEACWLKGTSVLPPRFLVSTEGNASLTVYSKTAVKEEVSLNSEP